MSSSEASNETLVAVETEEDAERRTSYLELFFDLVFVFAITQVTTLLLSDTTVSGCLRATLVLAIVYWAWSGYTWMTNAVAIEQPAVRAMFLLGMAGSFFMALAVPDVFGEGGLWFVCALVLVRLVFLGIYIGGLRGQAMHQRAVRRLAWWFNAGTLLFIAGGFVDGDARAWLWLAALGVDVAGTLVVGRSGSGFRVSPDHFAERYALFIIIALGESVVAVGIAAVGLERNLAYAVTVAVAFAGVAALWWAYFDFTAIAAARALRLAAPERRGPLARDMFTFFHFPLVLGVIFYAVAAKKVLAHPHDPLSRAGRWALGLGIALYLMSFVLMRFRVVRLIAWERVAGGAAVIAVVLLFRSTDAIVLLSAATATLAGVVAIESIRLRDLRRRLRQQAG